MNKSSLLEQETNHEEFLRVPYGKSVYGEEEIAAVVQVLRTNTQMGKCVKEMEKQVAALFEKKHGIMVNSGSSANYLAIEILNLPEGSEVITPALTFSTTVAPIIKNRLVPVFADVEEGTYNIDATKIEALITKKTKALMIPNLIGNLPDWKKIKEIANRHQLIIIEDSADTLGASIKGKKSGSFSDISTTSFYGSHVINCGGNGGMLCVNDPQLARKAILLRSWGRSSSLFNDSEAIENRFNISLDEIPYDNKFVFEDFGYNLEPSEMGAAFGLVQLTKLDENIQKREFWFEKHNQFFKKYEQWFILPKQLSESKTGWLAYPIVIRKNAPFKRTQFQIFLEKRNIQTRTIFTGNILRQPCFKNKSYTYLCQNEPLVHADAVMQGGVLIACHHGLNAAMLDHLHRSIELFCKSYEKN